MKKATAHYPGTVSFGPGHVLGTCSCGWESKPRRDTGKAYSAAKSHARNHGMAWDGFRWAKESTVAFMEV